MFLRILGSINTKTKYFSDKKEQVVKMEKENFVSSFSSNNNDNSKRLMSEYLSYLTATPFHILKNFGISDFRKNALSLIIILYIVVIKKIQDNRQISAIAKRLA
jgi:hypothetical protein